MANMALRLPLAAILRTARVLSIRHHRLTPCLSHGFSALSTPKDLISGSRLGSNFGSLPPSRQFSSSRQTCSANTILRVPTMAESITEGTLVQMKKNVGDFVEQDEELATIETDKIDVSVNAPHAGIIQQWLASEGDTVAVEQVIAELQSTDEKVPGDTSEIEKSQEKNETHAEKQTSQQPENSQEKRVSSKESGGERQPVQAPQTTVSQESKAASKEHRVCHSRINRFNSY